MHDPTHNPCHVPAGEWSELARAQLAEAGYRSSRPRAEVIDLVAEQECVRTAAEIADELRVRGTGIGTATVYRTLEALEELKLLQRLDLGGGSARYEPAFPDREHHHHHLVCEACGVVTPFEDDELERAIESLARRMPHRVGEHEVILRGRCPACAELTPAN
ncbi:transcriptional repressor [Thermoleophilia bacterium SCSIO 60948]|nr:transcriptional repressor [Thermoleophilia bacterium SCSIO 60948]